MIDFKKVNTSVRIELTGKWPLSKTYYFYWECNNEDFASLLKENLELKMREQIESIRREEYNRGWKDAKSKKVAKQTWFNSWW